MVIAYGTALHRLDLFEIKLILETFEPGNMHQKVVWGHKKRVIIIPGIFWSAFLMLSHVSFCNVFVPDDLELQSEFSVRPTYNTIRHRHNYMHTKQRQSIHMYIDINYIQRDNGFE